MGSRAFGVVHAPQLIYAPVWEDSWPMKPAAEQTLRPLIDYVDPTDIPLAEYLEIGSIPILDRIMVGDAWTDLDDSGFTLGATFYMGGVEDLHLPGLDQIAISFNSDAMATGLLRCGADASLAIDDIELSIDIDRSILRPKNAPGPARILATCGVSFDAEGFRFGSFADVSMDTVLVAGTDVELTLKGLSVDLAGDDFIKVQSATLVIPQIARSAKDRLTLNATKIGVGRAGPSGTFSLAAGPSLGFTLYGFSCEIESASLTLDRGQICDFSVIGRLDLSSFLASDETDGWVDAEFAIGPAGVTASINAENPFLRLDIADAFSLGVRTIRLEPPAQVDGGGILWLSGELTPHIEGTDGDWPVFEFDEVGITSKGEIRLAQGATIAATQPFDIEWRFARLTVSSFSLQRPKDEPAEFELRLSAAVELIQGLPVGASVDGLVVRTQAGNAPRVSFSGIGMTFGSPGAYAFAAKFAWDSLTSRFSGSGHIDVESIDLRLSASFTAEQRDGVPTVFLTADTELIPGGIPIGSTGLSLYGVSGLLAHNLKLKVGTGPRRYFDAFNQSPPGFADIGKWEAARGTNALALGAIIGTSDDGWAFSCRGGLLLSVPDLTLLVTAEANILDERMKFDSTASKLTAVLAVYPPDKLLRLDFTAEWAEPGLFQVSGQGGGEFYFDRPLDWKFWLGKRPSEGSPVSARALQVKKPDWLLDANYWFGIDAARSANVGLQASIELKAGLGGIYAELAGSIGGDVTLSWNPAQLDGEFSLLARARLAAGGLSLSINVGAEVDIVVAQPKSIVIPLHACIEIDLGLDSIKLCLSYTFEWRNTAPPDIAFLPQGLSAVPRFWTQPPAGSGAVLRGDGIVFKRSDAMSGVADLGTVAPHSELVLEFPKSMNVALNDAKPAQLNDVATPYPQRISDHIDYVAEWSLTSLTLKDVTDNREVDLFGTFSRSPVARRPDLGTPTGPSPSPLRPPNTELRLLSSRRFGQDGSLSGGGAEDVPGGDCVPKDRVARRYVELANLQVGSGRLSNGWPYQWIGTPFEKDRDNRYGVELGAEDQFRVWASPEMMDLGVVWAPLIPHTPPAKGSEVETLAQLKPGKPLVHTDRSVLLTKLYWDTRIGDVGSGPQDWKGSSGAEEWTLDAAKRLLIPGHAYSLHVAEQGQLFHDGAALTPIQRTRDYMFTASRAPDWADALRNAVTGAYPGDGSRPVFRDYDLLVQFADDFFDALYQLDKRLLGVCLRDANGTPLKTAAGEEVLLPTSWIEGTYKRSPAEDHWGKGHAGNPADGCEHQSRPPPDTGNTVLPIKLQDLGLLPLTPYMVELVAVETAPGVSGRTPPLASWSFTTSAFKTFTELAASPALVPSRGLSQSTPSPTNSFDSLIRSFSSPSVTPVAATRMTPVRADDTMAYLLIEAPEPLDDATSRLKVSIDGTPATALVSNVDRTRLIARLAAPIALNNPNQTVSVDLEWAANPANAFPIERRTIGGTGSIETAHWLVPLAGLY